MYFFPLISIFLLLAGVDASPDIPYVDRLVSSVMNSLAAYTEFATPGPTATAVVTAAPVPVNSTVHESVSAVSVEAADAAYWLADISHQGIAAFNPNPSGYKVLRNVKDYGAKGEHTLSMLSDRS